MTPETEPLSDTTRAFLQWLWYDEPDGLVHVWPCWDPLQTTEAFPFPLTADRPETP